MELIEWLQCVGEWIDGFVNELRMGQGTRWDAFKKYGRGNDGREMDGNDDGWEVEVVDDDVTNRKRDNQEKRTVSGSGQTQLKSFERENS